MIAFVTGGTGFVGGHLCETLRREGWEVRALARSASRAALLSRAGCSIVEGDLDASQRVGDAIAGADIVFHLAGLTKAMRPGEFDRVNGEGVGAVASCAASAGFRGRFVLVSSLAAAGPAVAGRIRVESDPEEPVSDYGRSKLLGERRLAGAGGKFERVVVRPGAIYGPRERDIYEVVKPIARSGIAIQPGPGVRVQLTHVEDVVSATIRAATATGVAGRPWFINDPASYLFGEVMGLVGAALGRRVRVIKVPLFVASGVALLADAAGRIAGRPVSPLSRDKVRELRAGAWIADPSGFAAATGWHARWGLAEGLRETVAWYKREGWL